MDLGLKKAIYTSLQLHTGSKHGEEAKSLEESENQVECLGNEVPETMGKE